MLRSTRDSRTMRKSAAVSRAAAHVALASDRHRLRHTRSGSPLRRALRIRPTAALAATAHSRILSTVPISPASGGGAEFGLAPARGDEECGGDRRPSTGHVFSRLAAGLKRALPLARTATTTIERVAGVAKLPGPRLHQVGGAAVATLRDLVVRDGVGRVAEEAGVLAHGCPRFLESPR